MNGNEALGSRSVVVDRVLHFEPPAQLVLGELGLGKSTLVRAVLERARRPALQVTCRQAAAEIPYEPLQALVDELARAGEAASARIGSPSDALVVRDALARWSSQTPGLVVLEDVHWADRQSLASLVLLVDRLQDYPLAWLLTARPGYAAVNAAIAELGDLARSIDLPRLPDVEIAALLRRDGSHASDADVIKARGNPLFATLVAGTSSRGDSIDSIAESQVADLTDDERAVGEALAVADRPLGRRVVELLARLSEASVRSATIGLLARGVVAEERGEFSLRHAIWQQAFCRAIAPEQLQRHHSVLAALASDSADRARHLAESGETERARNIFADLAWESSLRRLWAEARTHAQSALAIGAPATGLASDEGLFALLRLLNFFHSSPAQPLTYEARRGEWGNLPAEVVSRLTLAHSIWYRSSVDNARELALLQDAADKAPEPRVAWRLRRLLGALALYFGSLDEAIVHAERLVAETADDALAAERLPAQVNLDSLLMRRQRKPNWATLRRAMDQAEEERSYFDGVVIANTAASLALTFNNEAEAIAMCERAFAIPGLPYALRGSLTIDRAHLFLSLGDFERALATVLPFEAVLPDLDFHDRSGFYFVRIQASSCLGLFSDATAALEEWTSFGYPDRLGMVAFAGTILAELRGDFDTAIRFCGESIRRSPHAQRPPTSVALASRLAFASKDPRAIALYAENRCEPDEVTDVAGQMMADGYAAAVAGRSAEAIRLLGEFAEATSNRWDRAWALLHAGELARDSALLRRAAQEFSACGSGFMVERVETTAANLKLDARTPKRDGDLSHRERSVAILVAAGRTNPEIADELSISRRTVETHVANILLKLGVRSRIDIAVIIARESEAA